MLGRHQSRRVLMRWRLTWCGRGIGRGGTPAEGVGQLGPTPLLLLLRLQLPQELHLQPAHLLLSVLIL